MGFLGVSWIIWGAIALIIAGLFAVFVPYRKQMAGAEGIRYVILRWFHSLLWLMLAVSFFLRLTEATAAQGAANLIAAAAGMLYGIFMITLFTSRRS
jgi:hypothetical protein